MYSTIGSRRYNVVDYKASCLMSGVSSIEPIQIFKETYTVMLRADLVSFCFEFLEYKFNLSERTSITLDWSVNAGQYPIKVYREGIEGDYQSTGAILIDFSKNFLRSEAEKIVY